MTILRAAFKWTLVRRLDEHRNLHDFHIDVAAVDYHDFSTMLP